MYENYFPQPACNRAKLGQVVLDSAASIKIGATTNRSLTIGSSQGSSRLLIFSANHADSLRRLLQRYQEYLDRQPRALDDLSYTLGARREHLSHRSFCVTSGDVPLVFSPISKAAVASQIVFVFTGQGAQWAQMGVKLITAYPAFRETIRELDGYLSCLDEPSEWTIEGIMKGGSSVSMDSADVRQRKYRRPRILVVFTRQSSPSRLARPFKLPL
jgi:hypothetical protein